MKKKLLITTLLLLFVLVFISCKNTESNYPIEISFEDYSLEGSSCQWTNLPYNDKVIVINSNEELERYIVCTESSYPAIDFSTHSLLLASGKLNGHIFEVIATDLMQISSNKYKLNIEITSCNLTKLEPYSIALIVNKLKKEKNIEISVTHKEVELELGIYKCITPGIVTGSMNFFDRENLYINGLETEGYHFKYKITNDSIKLTNDKGVTTTSYFHIINNTKFERDIWNPLLPPQIPCPYIVVYEKRN